MSMKSREEMENKIPGRKYSIWNTSSLLYYFPKKKEA